MITTEQWEQILTKAKPMEVKKIINNSTIPKFRVNEDELTNIFTEYDKEQQDD